MPVASIGVVEPGLEVLADGRLLVLMRLDGPQLWQAYSSTGGHSWTIPTPSQPLVPGGTPPGAVWPQLRRLSNGALIVTSGRYLELQTFLGGSAGIGEHSLWAVNLGILGLFCFVVYYHRYS